LLVTGTPNFPGWYFAADETGEERFWNGQHWTDLTRPAPRLADFLGPIEPLLLSILGRHDIVPLVSEPTSLDDVWSGYRRNLDLLVDSERANVDVTII
jgi:hypothetical protein